jgi:hypothetical protein
MNDSTDKPTDPKPRRPQEYEDPHYHDDDIFLPPPDDTQPPGARPRAPRKTGRKIPPPRRHYED